MKFISFTHEGSAGSGVLRDEKVYPLTGDLLSHIASGDTQPALTGAAIPLSSVQLTAPLLNPPRIFGIGLNYREHAAESKMKVQDVPTVFLKLSQSLCGDGDDVLLPSDATQPDYEAELAVVIGRGGHRIAEADWQQHVFGYTILNDISARGVQLATTQWTLGKSFPTFTPLGPTIVTADEVPDPHALYIRLTLQGEVMQEANTRDLIFRIPALIAYLSSITPLMPGDIISTGTPPGVGLGRTPQRWLLPDEEMVIEIEKLGTLRNRTRAV
ncbi:fumarylacetoacetate hydrolase family protein [Granulicella tundricola]|uniref:Ureidoglycolate lyase n=1 Tax=Granulicella tundricola (strain ATCC BAA-1859 / DSM 23138 / MP5ACTX9) TaxID=1198114 RepID=E8X716_GRATM|nr:fumarylacetoacetate hydrolase family protein [Granulicella tundricola]ADW71125.1 Ureidoglycolate lyase [Granulicella tundricola MP5ACTX9]